MQRPPFFVAGKYPVDSRSESRFSEPSQKRFAAPVRQGEAGDAEEGLGEEGELLDLWHT